MKAVVLGAGLQGTACVFDLLRSADVEAVLLADQSQDALAKAQKKLNSPKVHVAEANIAKPEEVIPLMQYGQVTVSAVPYFLNEMLTAAAIQAGCHFVDMGGNTDVVLKQLKYAEAAQKAGVTIVPDMGLAPGYANLLAAELIAGFDTVDSVEIRVGGLPQHPLPPLDYQLFFSVEGLINEYLGLCDVLENGEFHQVKSLTGLETLTLPAPLGECEAFYTLGGTSTMPRTYQGRVKNFNYKTIRYPGHCEKLRLLEDLGFFEMEAVETRDGHVVEPRKVSAAILAKRLNMGMPEDYVVVSVTANGQKSSEWVEERFSFIDAYDATNQMTAMMRTTAFPVSIVAQLLGTGQIKQVGAYPPEIAVPVGRVRQEMEKRGIPVSHTQHALVRHAQPV